MFYRIFTLNVAVVFTVLLFAGGCGNPSDTQEGDGLTTSNDKAVTASTLDVPSSKEIDGEATGEKPRAETANNVCDDCPYKGDDGGCNCPHKKEGGGGGDCPHKKEGGCGGDCPHNAASGGGCPHRVQAGCPHFQEAF